MKKKNTQIGIAIFVFLLALGWGILIFFKKNSFAPESTEEFLRFVPAASSMAPTLTKVSEENIKSCLKNVDLASLEKELFSRLKDPTPKLVWKIWHLKGSNEKEYRLRLSNEPSERGADALTLKIFEVDREGLPDLINTEVEHPLNTLDSFLEGKRITLQVESMDYTGKNETSLHIEREDGKAVEIEFLAPTGRLACSGKEELSCHCFHPKQPIAIDDEELPREYPPTDGESSVSP
jgi:hypothetical protein